MGGDRESQDTWKFINKERRKKKEMGTQITMEEWVNHFATELGGVKENVHRTGREESREREEEEEEITDDEIAYQLNKLKREKAAGVDGIQAEAWIYSGANLRKRLFDLVKEVWRGGGEDFQMIGGRA